MPPSYVQKKSGRSCLANGCLILVALTGVIVLLLVGGGFYVANVFGPFFAEQPATLRANDTTKEQYMAVVRKIQPLINPDAPGQTAPAVSAPVSFSADDLNAFVAYDPHLAESKGKCYFSIPGDQLVMDITAPLPATITRSSQKIYFNGRVSGDVDISGKAVRLIPRSIESLDGKAFPDWFMHSSYFRMLIEDANRQINEGVHNNTDVSDAVARIASTRIGNGQLTLIPAGATAPPAPVATPANR